MNAAEPLPGWTAELSALEVTAPAPGVVAVVLNRPAAGNSRNQQMRDELARTWDWVATSAQVRAVVLTGAGEKYFCTGMDLKEAREPETALQTRDRLLRSRDIETLAALPVPTVAAINGYAVGGGLEMALACDLRIAADGARVGLPEVKNGLVPAGGGTQRLPRIVGHTRAADLVLSGRLIDAAEALAWGLCTRVTQPDALFGAAVETAEQLASSPRAALAAAKELLRRAGEDPISSGVGRELDALVLLLAESRSTAYHDND